MHDLSVAESGTASVCVVLLSVGEGLQRDVDLVIHTAIGGKCSLLDN